MGFVCGIINIIGTGAYSFALNAVKLILSWNIIKNLWQEGLSYCKIILPAIECIINSIRNTSCFLHPLDF